SCFKARGINSDLSISFFIFSPVGIFKVLPALMLLERNPFSFLIRDTLVPYFCAIKESASPLLILWIITFGSVDSNIIVFELVATSNIGRLCGVTIFIVLNALAVSRGSIAIAKSSLVVSAIPLSPTSVPSGLYTFLLFSHAAFDENFTL